MNPVTLGENKCRCLTGGRAILTMLDSIHVRTKSLFLQQHSQYVVVLDAGSTGSRVHVYEYDTQSKVPVLLNEVFELTRPGLSHFPNDPVAAAKSLDPLLDIALQSVPKKFHSSTPITLKATAGLRLLGEEQSQAIIKEVERRIGQLPFKARDVSILEGQDEAVYAWITANYLLGNMDSANGTAAVFDLGGASTQIVFEPQVPSDSLTDVTWEQGDHYYGLRFGGMKFSLYQHSHLGYGLMEARKKVHHLVVESQKHDLTAPIINPCISSGLTRNVRLEGPEEAIMVGPDVADPDSCLELTRQILKLDEHCAQGPCSFNGVYQPSISQHFQSQDLYIFSYFYDRISPLGLPSKFKLSKLKDLLSGVCAGPSHWTRSFQNSANDFNSLYDELFGRPEWCLDLSFMFSMLHDGYGIPLDREVTIEKKINGHELGWCLGASLPLLTLKAESLV